MLACKLTTRSQRSRRRAEELSANKSLPMPLLLTYLALMGLLFLTKPHSLKAAKSNDEVSFENQAKNSSQQSIKPRQRLSDNVKLSTTTIVQIDAREFKRAQRANSTASNSSLPMDLILNSESSVSKTRDWPNQIDRHSYNLSGGNASLLRNGNETSNNGTDLMDTSDSRYVVRRAEPRFDEGGASDEYQPDGADLSDGSGGDSENFIDGASSNLNEKKVVKELTRILSRGMSGATDQVRLETLENLRRRQKERKVAKDTRAKMFEDIIAAAIESHPEKSPKAKKQLASTSRNKNFKDLSNGLRSASSSSHLLPPSASQNLDPELTSDAETVMQHLQGLAAAIDTSSAGNSNEILSANEDSSDSAVDSENGEGDSSSASVGEDERPATKTKKVVVSQASDRPLVRQFKKIKKQISQRRKQLDQIKKLFNVELALNPKDGTLVGKEGGGSNSRKKVVATTESILPSSDQLGDEQLEFSPAPMPNRRTRAKAESQKSGKMRELMGYLRENPEILASVMEELTVDADPYRTLPISSASGAPQLSPAALSSRGEEVPPLSHSSYLQTSSQDSGDLNDMSWSNQRSVHLPLRNKPLPASLLNQRAINNRHADQQDGYSSQVKLAERAKHLQELLGVAADDDTADNSLARQKLSRRLRGRSASELAQRLANENLNLTSALLPSSVATSSAQSLRSREAEALLLKSLRERQLLNLARLDMVLAEKQQASKISSVYSALNSTLLSPSKANGIRINTQPPDSSINRVDQQQRQTYRENEDFASVAGGVPNQNAPHADNRLTSGRNFLPSSPNNYSQRSSEEVMHHFMVVNPNFNADNQNSNPFAMRDANSNNQFVGRTSYNSFNLTQEPNRTASHPYVDSPQGSFLDDSRAAQQPTLKRFKDWQDVSQTGASSWQSSDKMMSSLGNSTWPPYDLTPGGSSTNVNAQLSKLSSKTLLTNTIYNRQDNDQQKVVERRGQSDFFATDSSKNGGSSQQGIGDLSITRADLMRPSPATVEPVQASGNNDRWPPARERKVTYDNDDSSRGIGSPENESKNLITSDQTQRLRTPSASSKDYFSAYKQETIPTNRVRSYASVHEPNVKHNPRIEHRNDLPEEDVDTAIVEDDGAGAMWAK